MPTHDTDSQDTEHEDYLGALANEDQAVHGNDGTEPRPSLAYLLDSITAHMRDHMILPDEHGIPTLALWAAHTWATSSFYTTPRVILDSPEPGCGKSRVLEVLALYSHRAKQVANTSTAAVFRLIGQGADEGQEPPTFLLDETDTIFGPRPTPTSEELRGIINAGYKRGATVDRCEGDAASMRTVEFPTFAPMALAGLHANMPDTILTRSVVIHMRKRTPDEHVEQFRTRRAEKRAQPTVRDLQAVMTEARVRLMGAEPDLPQGVEDRAAEVWEPLIAVADEAGGHWPATARAACEAFVLHAPVDEDMSLGIRLLRDCRDAIKATGMTTGGDLDKVSTSDLLARLHRLPDAGWSTHRGSNGLTHRQLCALLRGYGVVKTKYRDGGKTYNGFEIGAGFTDAWRRYVDPVEQEDAA